jgi:hypothetical protein
VDIRGYVDMKVLDMMVFTICLRYFNIKGMRGVHRYLKKTTKPEYPNIYQTSICGYSWICGYEGFGYDGFYYLFKIF